MYNVLAHVKWFSEDGGINSIASLSNTEWLVIVLAILAGIVLMYFVDKFFKPVDKMIDKKLTGLRDWVPTVIRYSTAAIIIVNFWDNVFYASNIEYSDGTLHLAVNALLILVAVGLILGVYTRFAGAVLLVAFGLSFLVANDPVQLFDHLEFVAIGLFLLFAPAGKLSVAKAELKPLNDLSKKAWLATPLLKTFTGAGLIVLAFSEKLLNLTLANNFLVNHEWNVLSGFGMSDRNFIIMAAIIEILIGLTLVLNLASRLGVLVLVSTMVMTAFLLGLDEVFGHLFAIGLVAAVWIGPNLGLFKKSDGELSEKPA